MDGHSFSKHLNGIITGAVVFVVILILVAFGLGALIF